MNDAQESGNYISHLVQSLAELVDRLRHYSSRPAGPDSSGSPPAPRSRLRVLVTILNHPDLRPRLAPLDGLGPGLEDLERELSSVPGLDLTWLEPTLNQLAEALEESLHRLDEGESPLQIAAAPLWVDVLSRLDSCGTAREVMDNFDDACRRWEERWGDANLTVKDEADLSRRWRTFREYGDAVFGDQRMPGDGRPRGTIILLVAGLLQRDQLKRNLESRNYQVSLAESPEALAASLASAPAPVAVVCDCQEPTNHLTRVRGLFQQDKAPDAGWPPLILLGQGPGNPEVARGRAQTLKADGLWLEPFHDDPQSALFSPS